ncbi:MAG TPA: HNH endonuclease signature motif containing protein [Magnetospirillum sp.]|nr:HNH endonuclease signature motif containing protein [Magnetospirillum sp.]
MTRDFSKPVKRAALERAGNRCEAVGPLYGLPEGVRCNADLGYGFDFDHVDLWANSRDSSLDNVACVCRTCHRHKTARHDVPKAAKTVRQRDKANGIRSSRAVIPGSRKSKWKRTLDGRTIAR